MEGQQKYYVDENGQWEFPLGLRQLAMVQMDLNGRNKYGQDSGVGNVGNGLPAAAGAEYSAGGG